jgi:hypothetical protein
MKRLLLLAGLVGSGLNLSAADIGIQSLDRSGTIVVTNVFTNGVCTIEATDSVLGPWFPLKNVLRRIPALR